MAETDFSDPALQSNLDKSKQLMPHEDVEHSSIILQPMKESVPIGVQSYLLVALANLGPKMFNVTKVNGIVSDVQTGKALANFTRRMYGDPLGPREQRSFRFPFIPSKKLMPGKYRMAFSAYYNNREQEPYATVVYNETSVLVAGPTASRDLSLLHTAAIVAVLLAAAAAYTQFAPTLVATTSTSSDGTKTADEPSQWLPKNVDTVGALPKRKKAAAKKA